MLVFSDRKFIVVANNAASHDEYNKLTGLITKHGGEIVPWTERADGDVSPKLIIVAPSMEYERAEEMRRFMIPTVMYEWVYACVTEHKLVPMRPYSPDPRNFMRDVIACFSKLSQGDFEVFKAGITAAGGDSSEIVTRYTSHVVATTLETPECQLVLQSRKNNSKIGIKLVKPEWMDACMSLHLKVDDTPFLLDKSATGDQTNEDEDEQMEATQWQHLLGTFPQSDSPRFAVQQSMRNDLGSNILDGRLFFLATDLDLSSRVAKTVTYLIETNGGRIANELDQAQVYIGKWREGPQYVDAVRRRIIVGNIIWLYWLMIHQKFEKPTHLLHYPEVKGGLPAMKDLTICVTNYTGDARVYLHSLISSIGATYSGKLIEKKTTHLIAAYEYGDKFNAAKRWGIPVVNHLWIEDCFAYWQLQDTDSRLYTYFAPKLSMSTLVGARSLVASVLNKFGDPSGPTAGREHHGKRQAKQKAGDWLHDAMIIEHEFHENLRRGKIEVVEEDTEHQDMKRPSSKSRPKEISPVPLSLRPEDPIPLPQASVSEGASASSVSTSEPTSDMNVGDQDKENHSDILNRKRRVSTQPEQPNSKRTSSSEADKHEDILRVSSNTPKTSQPSSRPTSSGGSKVNRRIMISGMDDPPTGKSLAALGLSLVKTVPVQIMVAPRFLKTSKFLQSLADTEEFVGLEWVTQSLLAGSLLPTDEYRLKDEMLSTALENRSKLQGRGLFEGLTLRLDSACRDKSASFRELVKSHKGKIVSKFVDGVISVGSEDDEGQISWTTFIDCIQNMDNSPLLMVGSNLTE